MTFCPQAKPEPLATVRARKRRQKAKQMQLARAAVMPEGTRCQCGQVATDAHHIRPKSLGGKNTVENLRPACHACHMRDGHRRSA